MPIKVPCDKMKYDKCHDILHVFCESTGNVFADEEYPDIYVSRDEDTDIIVGLTVMNYKKTKSSFIKLFPQYQFDLNCIDK